MFGNCWIHLSFATVVSGIDKRVMQNFRYSGIIDSKKFFLLMIVFALSSACLAQADTSSFAKIGFKSLFANDRFNPEKPYLSQLSPKAVPFVQEYIRKQGKELEKMKQWGRPYFDVYDNILPQYGVPVEMKYLSVIESHLQCRLVSWAGAVGPWQLMDYEAKRFGLRVGGGVDERMDYYKSTRAAAQLLKELYDQFGDWLLVVAAYNGGAGRVRQAIRLSGSRDFWDLQCYLKEETRTHVKKFIGTHYIFEGGGGQTTMTKAELNDFKANTIAENNTIQDKADSSITITGRFSSKVVAQRLGIAIIDFNKWNAGFDKALANGETFNLRLPKEKISLFQTNKNEMLEASIRQLLDGN